MKTYRFAAATLSAVLLAGSALAGQVPGGTSTKGSDAAQLRDLESQRARVDAMASATKSGQQSLDAERHRLDRLISKLKAGQHVSPAEFDQAME